MSIYNELILPQIFRVTENYVNRFKTVLKDALESLDKFEEDDKTFGSSQEKTQNNKTHQTILQSINEDETDTNKTPETKKTETTQMNNNSGEGSTDTGNGRGRQSKKRSKDEVEDILSPEQDKRLKRNASAKAQSIITKQMSMNLTQKLRREDLYSSTRRPNHVNKENSDPIMNIQIKQEKISLPEPMDVENVLLKQDIHKDQEVMPPPAAPMPKSRRAVQKMKSEESSEDESGSGRQRSTRTTNLTDSMPPPESRKALKKGKSEDSSEETRSSKQRSTRTRKETDSIPPPSEARKAVQKGKSEDSSEEEIGSSKQRSTRARKKTDSMPPPTESRKAVQKGKSEDSSEEETGSRKQRSTRTRIEIDSMPPPPVPSSRPIRASSRATRTLESENMPPPETRPKRTRANKQASEDLSVKVEKDVQSLQGNEDVPLAHLSRSTKQQEMEPILSAAEDMPPPETRPKRTRAKKKVSDGNSGPDKDAESQQGSEVEKPRPKRTRRGQKAAEKEEQDQIRELQKPEKEPKESQKETQKVLELISPKIERISIPETSSPVLHKQPETKKVQKQDSDEQKTSKQTKALQKQNSDEKTSKTTKLNKGEIVKQNSAEKEDTITNNGVLTETYDGMKQKKDQKNNAMKPKFDETVTLSHAMNETVILSNNDNDHAPVKPKTYCNIDETVVLEACNRNTFILEKHAIMDCTVVLEKDPKIANLTDDNSLLTDDNSEPEETSARVTPPEPTSAVKAKVQKYEEQLAARTMRTKTRAMAKNDKPDKHTPPDKILKPVLSAESLNKMNSMIFNGKPPQVSSSASKPRSNLPVPKSNHPATTSKLSSISRHKEAAEETFTKEKEDARKKKEAILEAKREQQKKKREEKMAAAAAAREAAERERKLAMEAAVKDRMEKQAHADQGKIERLKEVEKKRLELARKAAETEERRKAEEQARQLKLVEEQKRADELRRKQIEEAEVSKKEALLHAKEIEKSRKEYMQKHKMKVMENGRTHTLHAVATPGTPVRCPLAPVHMEDGFQYLNSDEEETPPHPVPAWSTSKARKLLLNNQSLMDEQELYTLFSSRVFSPDLREIFPNVERKHLKRTSSAVWRTPPRLPTLQE